MMDVGTAGRERMRWWLRAGLWWLWLLAGMSASAQAQDAASLKARHALLREQLANNHFQRPLVLASTQTDGDLKGDVHAVIDQPFATIGPALLGMQHWCDILILHLNVKSCHASSPPAGDTLSLLIGRKFDQPVADAFQLELAYKVAASRPDYLQVALSADEGPLGTSDYRIVLEVVELDAKRSFLHMSYAYAYGMAARLAMHGYLSTIGRDKVGFSVVGHKPDGRPIHIGSVRGVVERNTMRYFLAIDAYLGALAMPQPERLDKRLSDWHAAIERYPLQLHEVGRDQYIEMKKKEVQRQQSAGRPGKSG